MNSMEQVTENIRAAGDGFANSLSSDELSMFDKLRIVMEQGKRPIVRHAGIACRANPESTSPMSWLLSTTQQFGTTPTRGSRIPQRGRQGRQVYPVQSMRGRVSAEDSISSLMKEAVALFKS